MLDLKPVVEQKARALFDQEHWLTRKETLPAFAALGEQLKFVVSAEGYCDGEWLYDLSWSDTCERSGSGYYVVGQPLVLETEETPD